MNILVFDGVANKKFNTKVKPILDSEKVNEMFVIRDKSRNNTFYQNHGSSFVKLLQSEKIKYFKADNRKIKFSKNIGKLFLGIKLIKKKKVDIIISFFLIPHGILGFLCAKIMDKPFAIALLGSDLDVYIKKNKLSWLYLNLLKSSDKIITRGTQSMKYLVEHGISNSKIVVINNYLSHSEININKSKKLYDLIFVGSLSKVKRIDVFLEILSKFDSPEIKAAIVGDGPLREYIMDIVAKKQLKSKVSLLGWQTNVENYLNLSKVFVLTSEREGLPQAMIEAMACGLPCVVPDVGDISDVVISGFNSIVVEPLNVNEYYDAISKLLSDDMLYDKLSRNAMDTITKDFSLASVTDKWEILVDGLSKNGKVLTI